MAKDKESGDNVVRFPGGAPSAAELMDAVSKEYGVPTAMIVVVFNGTDGREMDTLHYCTKLEMAMAGARLGYLAGASFDLPDDDDA